MRKVILYIAMSLDGFIADSQGCVHWLEGDGSDPKYLGSYPSFVQTIDTILMGYQTYNQITKELSVGQWPYMNQQTYVFTHHYCQSHKNIIFTHQSIKEVIKTLKNHDGKDIWVCGGSSLVNQLIDDDLIDCFRITVVPILLGDGIPLFTSHQRAIKLKLLSTQSYNGMIDIIYEKRK